MPHFLDSTTTERSHGGAGWCAVTVVELDR
jgi:hypothetical protein